MKRKISGEFLTFLHFPKVPRGKKDRQQIQEVAQKQQKIMALNAVILLSCSLGLEFCSVAFKKWEIQSTSGTQSRLIDGSKFNLALNQSRFQLLPVPVVAGGQTYYVLHLTMVYVSPVISWKLNYVLVRGEFWFN